MIQSHPSPDTFDTGFAQILAWYCVTRTTHTMTQGCRRRGGKSDTFQASQALHVVYPVWPNWDELSCFYWGPEVRWRRGSLCPGPRPRCLEPQWQRRSTVPHPLQEMCFIQDQGSQQAASKRPANSPGGGGLCTVTILGQTGTANHGGSRVKQEGTEADRQREHSHHSAEVTVTKGSR